MSEQRSEEQIRSRRDYLQGVLLQETHLLSRFVISLSVGGLVGTGGFVKFFLSTDQFHRSDVLSLAWACWLLAIMGSVWSIAGSCRSLTIDIQQLRTVIDINLPTSSG